MDNSAYNHDEPLVRYLDNELPPDEKVKFEKELAADGSLADRLLSLQSAREAVKFYGLRRQVAEVHGQMMEELQPQVRKINPVRRIIRYTARIAASVIIIVGGLFAYNFYSLSAEKIYKSKYIPYEISTVRSDNPADGSPVERLYSQKDYKGAVSLAFDRPFTPNEKFLRSLCFAELGNNSEAIAGFSQIIADNTAAGTILLNDEAEYYLALTYIRNKDYDLALPLLQKIHDMPGHIYHEKADAKLIRRVKLLKWR